MKRKRHTPEQVVCKLRETDMTSTSQAAPAQDPTASRSRCRP